MSTHLFRRYVLLILCVGVVDDLLKELQVTEMRELEEQLRLVNLEKQKLHDELEAKKSSQPSASSPAVTSTTTTGVAGKRSGRGNEGLHDSKDSLDDDSDSEEGDEYPLNMKGW